MAKMSDLPREVIEEILSRVPLASLRAVRSTCKTWNDTSKIQVLGQKAAGARKSQFLEFIVADRSLYSLRFDLRGVRDDDYELSGPSITKINVDISLVHHHCDGLLLCILKNDHTNILVWNPYLGQSRLIQTGEKYYRLYALGYDENRNHKILKIYDDMYDGFFFFEVYDFSSDSWRVLDIISPDEPFHRTVLSLKGNAYFTGRSCLVCFDFTTERFGRCMPLPYTTNSDSVDQFWVRDEKIAAAVVYYVSRTLEIWITTKIEPNEVSWSIFLKLDMSPINGLPYAFLNYPRAFFIDEEKKVVVLIDRWVVPGQCQILAHVIGEDGYVKSFNINRNPGPNRWDLAELVCCSYVPSLVQVQRDYDDYDDYDYDDYDYDYDDDDQPVLSHH